MATHAGAVAVETPVNDSVNTHRAVIEGSVPPRMTVIAAGGQSFCILALRQWLLNHRPEWDEVALVSQVVVTIIPENRQPMPDGV